MRPLPQTIRLGSHEWLIRPLTLRQIQEIEPILLASNSNAKGNVAAAIAIVAIALCRDHAEDAASLNEVEATAPEIGAAMATVLRLGGFIEAPADGDCTEGEAQAGGIQRPDPPASISILSMQGS